MGGSETMSSERSTFASDVIPPVPPLPTRDNTGDTVGTNSSKRMLSFQYVKTPSDLRSIALPSGASTSEALYHAVYDLLGVKKSDRPSPLRSRPHSEITPLDPQSLQIQKETHARLRSGSVSNLADKAKAETEVSLAMA